MLIGISGKMGSGKNLVCTIIQGLTAAKKHNIENPSFEWIKKYYINSIWEQKAFAGKLKQTASLLTGIPVEMFEDQEFKNKVLPEEWDKFAFYRENTRKPLRIYSSREEAEKDVQIFKGGKVEILKMTPRKLLQIIGTDCIRDRVHPNAWVNALFADYNPRFSGLDIVDFSEEPPKVRQIHRTEESYWIITDMRFPNELEAVKSRGGITIRVTRTGIHTPKIEDLHPSETALDNAEFDYIINNDSSIEDLIHTVSLILKREKII